MTHRILSALVFLGLVNYSITSEQLKHINPPSLSAKVSKFPESKEGTKWALLVAGSRGYENYRHQADVCHAFQILKKGGLKEENIIVFMYDDIASDPNNPRPGVIINSPGGDNVYEGVPKDYTGKDANVQNLYAVILGNTSALTGGSGKVVDSGPNDHVFIYYSDHGSPGVVAMSSDELVYADDLINVLKQKHEANAYASMVFYLEACESGSMFEGLLPETMNIYAITAANASEDSFATYCPEDYPFISPAYDVCLGDVYSVSWIEDSEKHDLRSETLGQQLQVVRRRTAVENSEGSSHVMQYGSSFLSNDFLYTYMGNNELNDNYTSSKSSNNPSPVKAISQRDANLLHYQKKFDRSPKGSMKRHEAQKQLLNEISSRMLVDNRIKQISRLLFGTKRGIVMLNTVRPKGRPLVDDWSCLKAFVKIYEEHCGSLLRYGLKYMRAIANMCNAKITVQRMSKAAARICKLI
ncbi:vacuolar-processing enzyme [Phtheirospermum japonicum]|uniref:Vacuolar-processing enzyme n=1 Tax=Phtheirospermum japonicum TaxID=374723 RepID=A0A830B1B1_9LAMI|nr:vacuolar-processing enzyme [Phtheirospermum japonicum]